jgi:phosphohistidine swiveling domain-containing protein
MSTRLRIDSDPHPAFTRYSAGNFAEVAPERLSIVSWSAVGPPQERAMRALAKRLWPGSTWHTGSAFVFVGFFGARPYHNLSGLCHMAEQVPKLDSAHFVESYFEDAEPPPRLRGLDESRARRVAALPRLAKEVATLRPRLVELQGRVVRLEALARDALDGDAPVAAGEAFAAARGLLDGVWGLHMSATASLPALTSIHRAAGERATRFWHELEPWMNRPSEVVWTWLHEATALEGELGPAEFLSEPFYEIASGQPPWDRYARQVAAPRGAEGGAAATPGRGPVLDPVSAFWDMRGARGTRPLQALARTVSDTMSCREQSKSLAMRVQHVLRRLLPQVAAAQGLAPGDWAYLTLEEIARAHREPGLAGTAAARREDCERALETEVPDSLDFAQEPGGRPQGEARPPRSGRGVSGGMASGVVVGPNLNGAPVSESLILVSDALDAAVQPLLERVQGVLTSRGSLLSHVAILVRERGIPAVVGHPLATQVQPGDRIRIDGSTGEVERVDG